MESPKMAGFFERFAAVLVDAVIFNIVSLIIGMSFWAALSRGSMFELYAPIFAMLFGFLYIGWFYVNKGQTPGKMLMKIKVVSSDNLEYLSWARVFKRDILGKWISGFVFSLGYLWYFMDEKRRAWHDVIAKSYVVKTDDNGKLLMTGPESYPKEPVKTFLPLGFMVILFVLSIAGVIWLFSMFVRNTGDNWNYDYMQDIEMQQEQIFPDGAI